MNKNQELIKIDEKHYLPTFKRFPLALERGEGCYVWDADGNKYLDALAGIAVNALGHCHPRIVEAISEQAGKLMHVSNFFVNEPQVRLAQKLVQLSQIERVFFTNSGAESLEGAFKIARKYAHKKGRGGKIYSFKNAFHGRTLATIATGSKKYQNGFDPMPGGFESLPFNDIETVYAKADNDTAAFVIEPIQGEGGINVADPEFIKQLREFCTKEDIVLIFDEVQCGIARTGKWFAKDHFGVQPDIVTLAKGLGGGVPIGAILSNEKVSSAIEFGDHGTTFGGNPLVCAASLATLEVIEEEDLLKKTGEKGEWLKQKIMEMELPGVKEVRGMGLMIGIEFEYEAKILVMDLLAQGIIANATANNVLRLVPPLTISYEQLGDLLAGIKISTNKIG